MIRYLKHKDRNETSKQKSEKNTVQFIDQIKKLFNKGFVKMSQMINNSIFQLSFCS